MIDYFSIIHKYISPNSDAYKIYIPHVHMVTKKALDIARNLGLSLKQLKFIEEAGMLHDIGIIKTDAPDLCCFGNVPYIAHVYEGEKILMSEGLPKHARVASCHTGVGVYKDEIIKHKFPIPENDHVPETVEEEIISYADLFFSKSGDLWAEKSVEDAHKSVAKFGDKHSKIFWSWVKKYEPDKYDTRFPDG